MVLALIVGGLVAVLGVVFAIKPLWMWVFTESWKEGSEAGPEEGYLRYARTFGIILAVIGGGLVVLTLAM